MVFYIFSCKALKMNVFKNTIIFRHQRENLKKCSLRGLEQRSDFSFFIYPKLTFLDQENYILLTPEAPVLSKADSGHGLLLLDGTWRLAKKMAEMIIMPASTLRRSLPISFKTAYPRRQDNFVDPNKGLASIEALYIAYHILGYDCTGLLTQYFWAESFLEKNQEALNRYGHA
jgi:pre-rRNA-processing protein TSR3